MWMSTPRTADTAGRRCHGPLVAGTRPVSSCCWQRARSTSTLRTADTAGRRSYEPLGGHDAVIKLLLATGKVDVNSKDADITGRRWHGLLIVENLGMSATRTSAECKGTVANDTSLYNLSFPSGSFW
jgi:hypothetical protein